MQVYYLNNFFILRYNNNNDYYLRLNIETAAEWIIGAIDMLHRQIIEDGGYSPNFNVWNCFDSILEAIRESLESNNTDEETVEIIIGLLRTNKGAIISIAEMDVPFDIELIGRELIAVIHGG